MESNSSMYGLVVAIREAYATGKFSLSAITRALGGETKHDRILSQIVCGERFSDVPGPIIKVDFAALTPFVQSMRQDYAAGRSIRSIAAALQLPPLVVRRVLEGTHYRYAAGPQFPALRKRENPPELLQGLADLAAACPEWDQLLNPQRYVQRERPTWLQYPPPQGD